MQDAGFCGDVDVGSVGRADGADAGCVDYQTLLLARGGPVADGELGAVNDRVEVDVDLRCMGGGRGCKV